MCNKVKDMRFSQKGYTLIELAIVLVIVGILATPAIVLYQQNKIKNDYDKTGNAIAEATSAIGDFRAAYGRYPCPAPANVSPDNPLYGLENCAAAVSVASDRSGMGNIVIGSLPFKSMSLQEKEIYDAYGFRLTYAVTENLASSATFNAANGGITILDTSATPVSIITPADSGHFIVLSHGRNGVGAFSKNGVLSTPCVGNVAEAGNCDNDNKFYIGSLNTQYDDRAGYYSSESLAEWQLQDNNSTNIFLKNSRDMAIGVYTSDDVEHAETSAIRTSVGDSGGISANTFNFQTNSICEYGEANNSANCFNQDLLTDFHTAGQGLVCPADKPFLVGILDGQVPECVDKITVGCPNGMYMAGLNADQSPICRGTPPADCEEKDIVTTCGETRTLPTHSHGEYDLAYSGQCYKFPTSQDNAFFISGVGSKTKSQIDLWVALLNNTPREQSDCGDNAATAQVRDSYVCNTGTWDHVRAHERLSALTPSFPSDYTLNAGLQNAENEYPYSISADYMNSSSKHDCWCREDYQVTTPTCPSGTGSGIRIRKYRCPQTNSSGKAYITVYEDFSSCSCTDTTADEYQSCAAYYNSKHGTSVNTSQITGNVKLTYDYKCSGSGATATLTKVLPAKSVDVSACACPANDSTISREGCIGATTNDFTWDFEGNTYTEHGIKSIKTSVFKCLGTSDAYGLPTPGTWEPAVDVPGIPACTCDPGATEDRWEACPDHKEGTGIYRRFAKNCATDLMEDTGLIVFNDCNECVWNAGNNGEDSNVKLGGPQKQVGNKCDCDGNAAPVCWASGGNTAAYKTYTNCQCVADLH